MSTYNSTISWILDNPALVKVRKTSSRRKVPWYNQEITDAIRCRRKAELSWLSDKSNRVKLNDFYITRKRVANLMTSAKCLYYCDFLSQHKTNMKEISSVCDKLLGRKHDLSLPPSFSKEELASRFSDFFISMIAKIRGALVTNRAEIGNHISATACIPPKLANSCLLSEQDIIKIITKLPTKSCASDPIPAEHLKQHVDILVPILTKLVNASMQSGCFLDDMKEAWVKPLLKKHCLDLVDKNYRLVSNLQFMGKLIERAVTKQLTECIADHNLMEPMQSACKANQNTESALVQVKADILDSMDKQEDGMLGPS